MKSSFPHIFLLTSFLLVILLAPTMGLIQEFYFKKDTADTIPITLHEISDRWEYKWAGTKSSAIPDSGWKAIKRPTNPPQRNKRNILWLRNTIPYKNYHVPTILIDGKGVLLTFEVFLNGKMIYKFGTLTPSGEGNVSGISSHLIPLGDDYKGKELTLKVFSDYSNIGIRGKVILGSKADLIMRIIKKDIVRVLLGFFMIFLGIIDLFTYKEGIKKTGPVSMFGILAVSIGFYLVCLSSLKDLVFYAPAFWLIFYIVSMTLIPIGMMGFVWQTFRPVKNNYLHRIWHFHIGYALICQASFILALSSILSMSVATFFLSTLRWLLILEMILMVGITFKDALVKKSKEAQLYFCGFLPIMVAGTHDSLVGLGKIQSSYSYVPWGLIVFILTLEVIQRLNNIKTQNRLRNYARELEKTSQEKTELIGDLHDGIGGLVTNIKFLSEMGLKNQSIDSKDAMLSNISEFSSESLLEIGNFMQSLDEQEKDWSTVLTNFYHLGDKMIKSLGLSFELQKNIDENAPKPGRILFLNLLRIYREALTNITKHAKATSVIVKFEVTFERILLSIQDNGVGVGTSETKGRGMGSMTARAQKIGGTLNINSEEGTCIILEI